MMMIIFESREFRFLTQLQYLHIAISFFFFFLILLFELTEESTTDIL